MKNKIFILLLLSLLSKHALGYYYTLNDFQGLSNSDYRETLAELESTIKGLITDLSLVSKQAQSSHSNIYESSFFNENLDLQLQPVRGRIKKLPDRINFLVLQLDETMNRFINFEYAFINYLDSKDVKIFMQTKEELKEDMQRFREISADIVRKSERLHIRLERLFLRKKQISKYQYKEYMVLSQASHLQLFDVLNSTNLLFKEIIHLTNELNQHKRVANQIYDSYKRKLSLSLGVKDSFSFSKAFENKVIRPMQSLREKIIADRRYSDLDKNAFAYNYYYNQVLRAADYSIVLNHIGPDYLPESEMGRYRAHEKNLNDKLMEYIEKPGAIRSLMIFLETHYRPSSCKILFL